MAPLLDPEILAQYQCALANWNYRGYVEWKATATQWVKDHFLRLTPRDIAALMYQHVEAGGEIDQIPEQRPEWNDRDFHYDFRLRIDHRLIYIETVLVDDDPDDPTIYVVSIHEA